MELFIGRAFWQAPSHLTLWTTLCGGYYYQFYWQWIKLMFRERNGLIRVRVKSKLKPSLDSKALLHICPSQTFWGLHHLKISRWQTVYVNYTFFLPLPPLYILFQNNTHKYIQYFNQWLRERRLICKYFIFHSQRNNHVNSFERCAFWLK